MPTKIEWTNETWNPVTGCTPCSPGCAHCYAKRMARRLAGRHGYPKAPHHFDVTLHPERLDQPLRWRKPRMTFVCSMSDLFHEDVPTSFIADLWDIMAEAHQHTFQLLTKRADRLPEVFHYLAKWKNYKTPLPNVWGLVTVENQATADERIPWLLKTPFAVRGVSVEPCLSGVDLSSWMWDGVNRDDHPKYSRHEYPTGAISWCIVGGESGPGARPMHPNWARSLRDQCQVAGVPFFFKQWGAWAPCYEAGEGWLCLTHQDGNEITTRISNGVPLLENQWDETLMARVGKKRAGHLLDGREHHEFPIALGSAPDA